MQADKPFSIANIMRFLMSEDRRQEDLEQHVQEWISNVLNVCLPYKWVMRYQMSSTSSTVLQATQEGIPSESPYRPLPKNKCPLALQLLLERLGAHACKLDPSVEVEFTHQPQSSNESSRITLHAKRTTKWSVVLLSYEVSTKIVVTLKCISPPVYDICISMYFYDHNRQTDATEWYHRANNHKRFAKDMLKSIIESVVAGLPQKNAIVNVRIPCDVSKVPPEKPFAGFPLSLARLSQGYLPFYNDVGFVVQPELQPLTRQVGSRLATHSYYREIKKIQSNVSQPMEWDDALQLLSDWGMGKERAEQLLSHIAGGSGRPRS